MVGLARDPAQKVPGMMWRVGGMPQMGRGYMWATVHSGHRHPGCSCRATCTACICKEGVCTKRLQSLQLVQSRGVVGGCRDRCCSGIQPCPALGGGAPLLSIADSVLPCRHRGCCDQ